MDNSTPLGDLCDERQRLNEKLKKVKSQFDAKAAPFVERMIEIESVLQARMEEVGTTSARGSLASYTISYSDHPTISDPAKLDAWVAKTGNTQVFQQRLSPKAVLEARANARGKRIPGITFTQKATGKFNPLKT